MSPVFQEKQANFDSSVFWVALSYKNEEDGKNWKALHSLGSCSDVAK